MLEQFPGDVQRKVGGVHHALYKAEAVGEQVGALVHDEHAGGVELEALLILPGVEVVGGGGGDEEQGLEGHGALGGGGDGGQGGLPVAKLLPVEAVVLFLLHLGTGALPQGHHGVDGLFLHHRLPLGLVVVRGILRLLLLPVVLHLHADGVADIVGILFNQGLQAAGLQVLAVGFLLAVGLDVHDDVGARLVLFAFGDGVAVRPGGLPAVGRVLPVAAGDDGDLVRHHEGGVEAHAELADDVRRAVLFHALLELEGAAARDGAQVLLQLLGGHAHAVVRHREGPGVLVRGHNDAHVPPLDFHCVVRQGKIGQLVDGVAGVGDDLPEEDLLVGVDGVDHQVHQPLGFRFELLLCHNSCTSLYI